MGKMMIENPITSYTSRKSTLLTPFHSETVARSLGPSSIVRSGSGNAPLLPVQTAHSQTLIYANRGTTYQHRIYSPNLDIKGLQSSVQLLSITIIYQKRKKVGHYTERRKNVPTFE